MEQNKYKGGQIVFAKEHPQVELLIRRYVDRNYYYTSKENPS